MEYAIVTLKKGEGRALKAGGAWIYDNEIESVMGHFEDGDLVLVRDFDGYGLGKGFINRHSKITTSNFSPFFSKSGSRSKTSAHVKRTVCSRPFSFAFNSA